MYLSTESSLQSSLLYVDSDIKQYCRTKKKKKFRDKFFKLFNIFFGICLSDDQVIQ